MTQEERHPRRAPADGRRGGAPERLRLPRQERALRRGTILAGAEAEATADGPLPPPAPLEAARRGDPGLHPTPFLRFLVGRVAGGVPGEQGAGREPRPAVGYGEDPMEFEDDPLAHWRLVAGGADGADDAAPAGAGRRRRSELAVRFNDDDAEERIGGRGGGGGDAGAQAGPQRQVRQRRLREGDDDAVMPQAAIE